MKRESPSERDLVSLCREPGAEDGADPRKYFRSESNPSRARAVQLAGQVRRTLELVMAGESREPVLLDLTVRAVEPAPDCSHFIVVVTGGVEESVALSALGRAASWLRTEVADAVHRRKAPLLTFRFLPEGEVRP
jgi:ribosome-binding factor A